MADRFLARNPDVLLIIEGHSITGPADRARHTWNLASQLSPFKLLVQSLSRQHVVAEISPPGQRMPAWQDATVSQKIEGALLDLSQAPETVPVTMYWVPDMLKDNRAVGSALANITVGECQQMEVDIAIRHECAILIMSERMPDHQSPEESVSLGDLDGNLTLDLERVHVRE